ncbi:MAG: hypothetical protein ACREKL_15545 [Chthoniobacterales bacterium]
MKKTLGYLVLGLFVLIALPACNIAEKYANNNKAATQWLDTNAGSATIDVTGRWHADNWGGGTLTQKGNKITGTLGDYVANGVVKGRTVYLTLSNDGWVYYTIMARPDSSGALQGYSSESVPYSQVDEKTFSMVRSSL